MDPQAWNFWLACCFHRIKELTKKEEGESENTTPSSILLDAKQRDGSCATEICLTQLSIKIIVNVCNTAFIVAGDRTKMPAVHNL